MGWTDHEPHFTAIENIMEEQGCSYDEAMNQHIDNMREAAEAHYEKED